MSDAGWRGDVERLVTTVRELLPGIGNRTVEQARLEDGGLRFFTRSRETLGSDSLGKDITHRYTGQVTPEGIRFTLESSGGYTLNPPLEFVATRASP